MYTPGTKLYVNGKVCTVKSAFASGKHVQYTLDDGSQHVELHLSGVVSEVVEKKTFEPQDSRRFKKDK